MAVDLHPTNRPADLGVPEKDVRAELDRLLNSQTFQRSERLRKFIAFVCERTLQGDGPNLNEYLIGLEVFERGPDYSPQEDSIVRRQAHALRQKLAEYYRTEGESNPVRIELPIGRYIPSFSVVEPARVEDAPQVEEVPLPREVRRSIPWLLAATGFLLLAIGFLGGWIVKPQPDAAASPIESLHPAVREIWMPWFTSRQPPVVCFSNPMTAVAKLYPNLVPPSAQPDRIPANPALDQALRREFDLPAKGYVYVTPTRAQTKLGEAVSAGLLGHLFGRVGLRPQHTQSRLVSWESLRTQNLILLGHDEQNAWVDPLLEGYPLQMKPGDGRIPRRIINTQPREGELREFHIEYAPDDDDSAQEYALVSMIPGVDRRRNLLLISGLNTMATQIATEYLTDQMYLQSLVEALRKEAPDHKGQWHFQAVLRCAVVEKTPTRSSLVLARVIQSPASN